MSEDVGAVIIGRNEGDRLIRCLGSILGQVSSVIYVDSGSTDGSVEAAEKLGVTVVALDMSQPFTAARARNAGAAALPDGVGYIQFVDGDCEVQPTWIAAALAFLADHPKTAVVCGRRRETAPDASIYNRLCDVEWNTPVGEALSCGGDAMIRRFVYQAVGGYRDDLIAGEEPEMCVRIRQSGWSVWRLDQEMTLHDAAILKFGQWWTRAKRAGHAFAEGAYLHGEPPERHSVKQTRRGLIWGAVLPALILLGAAAFSPWVFAAGLIYPLQASRLAVRDGGGRFAWISAIFMTLGKFAEAQGALTFWVNRLTSRRAKIMEY